MSGNSGDIDKAVMAKLSADAALMALATDGVYWALAPAAKTKFVVVSLSSSDDVQMQGGRAFEDITYLVKYVEKNSSAVNAVAAADRIDAILNGGTLTVPGYSFMTMQRVSRIREPEMDETDATIVWQHFGGDYQVVMST